MSGLASSPDGAAASGYSLRPVAFEEISGWRDDSHGEALAAFRRGCTVAAPDDRRPDLRSACLIAASLGAHVDDRTARGFFEKNFSAYRVVAGRTDRGLFTGYYEPELPAARSRSAKYHVPLLAPPEGLVSLTRVADRGRLPAEFTHALRRGGRLVAAPTRAEITSGALGPLTRPIAWLADPVDAFFLHVQGSGRLRYPDGTSERVTYAGKNGHPYTSIGGLLVRRGIMAKHEVSMQSLRAWLKADRRRGEALMNENRSYIFFRRVEDKGQTGPVGQYGVPLTPRRSLAIDLAFHAGNLPIWLETTIPGGAGGAEQPFRRLMISQDTGSAIRGPIRGDIYFGSGREAGEVAGRMQASGRMIVLRPHCSQDSC